MLNWCLIGAGLVLDPYWAHTGPVLDSYEARTGPERSLNKNRGCHEEAGHAVLRQHVVSAFSAGLVFYRYWTDLGLVWGCFWAGTGRVLDSHWTRIGLVLGR